ncbi:hypothetical protein HS088_TW17G00777 [Tripterygium wilfordii]|uniref:Uncharacterized protein n=1 Tax=Tripterygium wilfordii TaxID=458696 RepID=A0A7J7CGR8_TRIWF|nr:hypothetical protein HS088_TW17G00777 [Tripterygium wilfordii]
MLIHRCLHMILRIIMSPRPHFLHYKPNSRIEIFLKAKDAKQLEQSFVLESHSDKKVNEETQSEDSEKEPENFSSNDISEEEEENEKDDEELCKT